MARDSFLSTLSEEMQKRHYILAHNIETARKARGWTQEEAAKRCLLSLGSYRSAEKGSLGTAIGVYWAILDTFGLAAGVEDLAAPHKDEMGLSLRSSKYKLSLRKGR